MIEVSGVSFQDEIRQIRWETEYAQPIAEVSQFEIDDCAKKVCDCIRDQLKKQASEGKLLYAVRYRGVLVRREEQFSLRYQTKWSASVRIDRKHFPICCAVLPYEERVESNFFLDKIETFSRILNAVEKELQQDDIFSVNEYAEGKYRAAYRTPMQGNNYFRVVQEIKNRESVEIRYSVDIAYFIKDEPTQRERM